MSKCLRCGAGPEWLQGRVSDETPEIDALRAEVERLTGTITAKADAVFKAEKARADALRDELERLTKELAMVDEAIARRDALADAPNRYTAIYRACTRAGQADAALAERDALLEDRCENGHHTHAECSEACSCVGAGKSRVEKAEAERDSAETRVAELLSYGTAERSRADAAEAECKWLTRLATCPPVVTRELARAREGRDKAEARVATLEKALGEIDETFHADSEGYILEPCACPVCARSRRLARAALAGKP